MQRHGVAGDQRGQRGGAGPDTLDAGKAHFTSVLEPKGAVVDHGADTTFALQLEAAAGRGRALRCDDHRAAADKRDETDKADHDVTILFPRRSGSRPDTFVAAMHSALRNRFA